MTTADPTPDSPDELNALYDQALREHHAGRTEEAAELYRKILDRWPNVPEVHNNLGIALGQQGQIDLALLRFEQAIALNPDLADARNNLGNLLRQQGKLDQATTQFQQVIALRPDYAPAHNTLGTIFFEQGKLDQAAAQFEQAIALRPEYAEAHFNLGNVVGQQGQLEPAIARFEQAIALRPDYPEALNILGTVYWHQNKFDKAHARLEQAIALRPEYTEAHYNLGNVLLSQNKFDEAAIRFERALALRPDYAEAHNKLGTICWHQSKFDQAAARYARAIAARPTYAEAYNNLGSILHEQLKLTEARQVFQRLEALEPGSPFAQFGLGIGYLVEGDYERGWRAFEGRRHLPGLSANPGFPLWRGEPLAGRSLLLLAEDGLGDTIQFVRYARTMKRLGARVVLACPAALGRLLASNTDLDELFILGTAEELPRCDFYLPLLSAPGALGTNASTIPCDIPYLSADPKLMEQWRREFAAIEGFKIGIVWQGSRNYFLDRWRSIPLAQFAPLARLPDVRLISLQKGLGPEQFAGIDFPVIDLSNRLDEAAGPFMDTAAVIQNLDLVITADTAVGHLAGALGAPVWIALPFSTDWRWLLNREDSPWYPSVRLFRQTKIGEWPDVFERMAKAVQERRSQTA
jgi:tetratricopeptide (TPR) repeat protein